MVFSGGNAHGESGVPDTNRGPQPQPRAREGPKTDTLPPVLGSHLLPNPRAGAQAQSRGESPAPPRYCASLQTPALGSPRSWGGEPGLPRGPPSQEAAQRPAWGCFPSDRLRSQEGKEGTAIPSRMPWSRHREEQGPTSPL